MKPNSTALDTFSPDVMKIANHTRLWDAELAWYSQSATHQICLNGLKHGFGIQGFRFIWTYSSSD